MTGLLLRLFVKNYTDAENTQVRTDVGKLAGVVGIFCNGLLFFGKLVAGLLSGSVAIVADAVNNLSDASSSVVTLLGFRLAQQPADADHPYGHARYEYLSGLMVAVLILVIGVELVKTSIGKILHPANVECTAEYLLQFAYMGKFYTHDLLGCEDPRIGLLNIGAEETKGTELQKQTFALLKEAHEAGRLNFVGNVEARDVFSGNVDVLVCDGFSGNVLLKCIEGTAMMLMKRLKGIFYKNTANKLAAAVLKKDVYALKSLFDPSEVGGTALLGISKPVIKAHGSSDARAIRSAVRQAITFIDSDVIGSIEKNVAYMRISPNEGE